MDVVRISEPRNWSYPFAESLFEDPQVVYHGIFSASAATIEQLGLQKGGKDMPIDLLRRLIDLADVANFKTWSHRVIRGLSSSTRLVRPTGRSISHRTFGSRAIMRRASAERRCTMRSCSRLSC
jgi:hypothetical protein